MGSIRWPSNPGSGSTEDTAFIKCVDGWKPQIHEFWYLGLDNTTLEVHPAAQVEVITGTVKEFLTDYLSENGRRIQIIGQPSVNNSIHFLVVPAQVWGRGLPFIFNLNYPVEATG